MGVRRPGAAAMASPLRERPLETLRAPLLLGLLLLALHLAGIGATYRPRVGTRRR